MNTELPYAGTSGWSGTDTSEERAREADESGVTSERQALVLEIARQHGAYGVTVKDLRDQTSMHHGTASGALSVLHKAGRLLRLVERRDRCHMYVLPRYQLGRDIQPHGREDTITISRDRYEALVEKAELYDNSGHGR